jgi:hypothetical protein
MKRAFHLVSSGPDYLIEELTSILSAGTWVEFKPLFLVVFDNLRQRKVAGCGEEMLRLRAYDKLQNLVRHGFVEKAGKQYRGIPNQLSTLTEHISAQHCKQLLDEINRP